MASSTPIVPPDANRSPSFHRRLFTNQPSVILFFPQGSNYWAYFINGMIMIIWFCSCRACRLRWRKPPRDPPPAFFQFAVKPPFIPTHFLGVWTYCGVSVMRSDQTPAVPAPEEHQESGKERRGWIIKRSPFVRCGNNKARVWSFACRGVWMGTMWGLRCGDHKTLLTSVFCHLSTIVKATYALYVYTCEQIDQTDQSKKCARVGRSSWKKKKLHK